MGLSPFQEAAPKLLEAGYSVVPLQTKSKACLVQDWTRYCHTPVSEAELALWLSWHDMNIGLCLGSASKLIAVDLDYNIDGLHEKIKAILPPTPVKKKGSKGETLFYRWNGEFSQVFRKEGKAVCEILSSGRQTVIPPSIHPDGSVYQWTTPDNLYFTNATDIPTIPTDRYLAILALFDMARPEASPAYSDNVYQKASKDEIQQALDALISSPEYVSKYCQPYDMWMQIGMAIKSHLGDAGFPLWDSWSKAAVNYSGEEANIKKWRSFKREGVSVASLFYYAYQAGYKPQRDLTTFTIDGVMVSSRATSKPNNPFTERMITFGQFGIPPSMLNAPGLPGELAKFICDTSRFPQPALSLAAALACVGQLMGQKVELEETIRSNIYTVGVGPTGSGKDHARTVINYIYNELGYLNYIMGEPASAPALLRAIHETGGSVLLMWDEIGHVLRQLRSKNSQSYQAEILTTITKLYTSAHTFYKENEKMYKDRNKLTVIQQPNFCLYGTGTGERIYEAVSRNDLDDGTLPRFLFFHALGYVPECVPAISYRDIPSSLRDAFTGWITRRAIPVGEISPRPEVLTLTTEARNYYNTWKDAIQATQHDQQALQSGYNSIFSRTRVHGLKLALLCHTPGQPISVDVIHWATQLAEALAYQFCYNISMNFADSQAEDRINKIHRYLISLAPNWVSKGEIVSKFRALTSRDRDDALTTLVQMGAIEVERWKVSPTSTRETEFMRVRS